MLLNIKKEEFNYRISEMAKARKIFIPNITNSLTIAWEMYQEILAKDRLALFISTVNSNLTAEERPKCSVCKEPMFLNINPVIFNDVKYLTSWHCRCGVIEYSEYDVDYWKEVFNIDLEG